MRAFVIAVGSELLETDRLDTNSLRLAECFRRYAVGLVGKSVAGDDPDEIARQLAGAMSTADLIVLTGGLGPTADDRTRDAVADVLGVGMTERAAIVEDIRERFRGFGMEMPEVNRRQAMVPDGATVLANDHGTAPGLRLERDGVTLFLLPGVPRELDALMEAHLEPWLAARGGGERLHSRSLRVSCRSESSVEEALTEVYAEFGVAAVTVLAGAGDVEVRFTTRGRDADAAERLRKMLAAGRRALGPSVYAAEREATLERIVGELLVERGLTVGTAESCTGGLIAERLTDVPGSSDYFLGGIVTYSDEAKTSLLGVAPELLAARGAVSEEVAVEMARGARSVLGADWGLSSTGIAGPGGGSDDKPVGTVHVAVAGPAATGGGDVEHRRLSLVGDRQRVRRLTSQWALELLRRRLLP